MQVRDQMCLDKYPSFSKYYHNQDYLPWQQAHCLNGSKWASLSKTRVNIIWKTLINGLDQTNTFHVRSISGHRITTEKHKHRKQIVPNKQLLLSHHVSSVFLRKYFFPFLIADFFTPRIPKQAIREQLLTLYRNQELFFYLYNVILTTRDVNRDQQS